MLERTGAEELKLGFWNIEERLPASGCGCAIAVSAWSLGLEEKVPPSGEPESKDSGGNEGAVTFSADELG